MRAVIRAADAEPLSFYRSRRGRVLQIVDARRVDAGWPRRPTGAIAYRIKANPRAAAPGEQVAQLGWLPADYPLRPAAKPAWWARADATRARNLKRRRRETVTEAAPGGEEGGAS